MRESTIALLKMGLTELLLPARISFIDIKCKRMEKKIDVSLAHKGSVTFELRRPTFKIHGSISFGILL